jgi:tetratricopeptide (TPR) repeat protein
MFRKLPVLFGSALVCASFSGGAVYAQASPSASKPATATLPAAPDEPKPDAILKGEIRLDGRVTAMTGGTGFDIKASSFSTPDGRTIEFDAPRDKSIGGSETTRLVAGDDLTKPVPWSAVKLGTRVGVIGREVGKGKPFQARLIVLSDYSSKYVAGRSIPASAPVSLLVRRGNEAFEASNYEQALKLFQQAAGMATGTGDKSGAVLANSWMGNALTELDQPQKAQAAFATAVTIAEGMGNAGIAATAMNNMGMSFLRSGQPAEAVKWLERSNTLKENESEESRLLGQRNLARALAANKEFDRALTVWRAVQPRLRALNQPDQEASVLLDMAGALRESGQASEASRHVELARERIDASDPTRKGAILGQLGAYLAEAGDKEGARTAFASALAALTAQGDARAIASLQLAMAKLDAPAAPAQPAPAQPAPAQPAPAVDPAPTVDPAPAVQPAPAQ